jgi:hypothetical protein
MVFDTIVWQKVTITHRNDPTQTIQTIFDAIVIVENDICHVRTKNSTYSYIHAVVKRIDSYSMNINAEYFRSIYNGDGTWSDHFHPVDIACDFETRATKESR